MTLWENMLLSDKTKTGLFGCDDSWSEKRPKVCRPKNTLATTEAWAQHFTKYAERIFMWKP